MDKTVRQPPGKDQVPSEKARRLLAAHDSEVTRRRTA